METRFPTMGTTAHVVVLGGRRSLATAAQRRLEDLDARWSRFRPDSEVSRLNAAAGAHVPTSAETALLVRRMVDAWELTAGLCDASVHDAVLAAGYDRTFAALPPAGSPPNGSFQDFLGMPQKSWNEQGCGARTPAADDLARPVPGMAGVTTGARWVHLPAGTRVDPGAIGKGLAADLVAEELIAAGADGALINVGGDLRAAGTAPQGGWRVAVEGPLGGHAATLTLNEGAVATTTGARRRWATADGTAHHVLDPRTGSPACDPQRSITVAAAEGWLAEALATAAFLDAGTHALAHAAAALEVGHDHRVRDLLDDRRVAA